MVERPNGRTTTEGPEKSESKRKVQARRLQQLERAESVRSIANPVATPARGVGARRSTCDDQGWNATAAGRAGRG
jgi:hypothetical protein